MLHPNYIKKIQFGYIYNKNHFIFIKFKKKLKKKLKKLQKKK